MAASILYNPREQFTLDDGTICAGGTLYFYAPESTTPKNVYSDVALATSLGATVELDSAGRTPTDVFLSGSYNVELKDADGAQVWLAENVNSLAEGGLIPLDPADGDDGQVYSTDGVSAEWRDVSEVPDVTGHSGKYLGTDGDLVQWTAFAEEEVFDYDNLPGGVEQTATTFRIGNMLIQTGTGTVPTASAIKSSVGIVFGTAYDAAPLFVGLTPTVAGVTSDTPTAHASMQATSLSAAGFTANAFCGAENNGGNTNITSSIPFVWFAIGIKAL